MDGKLTRGEFLAKGGKSCLVLAAGGVLLQGCKDVDSVDVEKTRPPGAPANFIAKEGDVKPAYYFVKGKLKGVLALTDKGIVGYANKCTHEGGPNELRGGQLVCLWHGSKFDAATGNVLNGPATKPLTRLKLEIKDGMVLLAEA